MATSPMGPLSRIGKRLQKDARKAGLELRSFTGVPSLDDESGPHHAQAVFTLNEDFVPEPPKDDEWEKFEIEQAEHAQREREEEAKKGLAELTEELSERLRDPGKGIL